VEGMESLEETIWVLLDEDDEDEDDEDDGDDDDDDEEDPVLVGGFSGCAVSVIGASTRFFTWDREDIDGRRRRLVR